MSFRNKMTTVSENLLHIVFSTQFSHGFLTVIWKTDRPYIEDTGTLERFSLNTCYLFLTYFSSSCELLIKQIPHI